MSWHLERSSGGYIYEHEPLTQEQIWGRNEEIAWLEANRRPWKLVNGLLAAAGDPVMISGGLAGLVVNPITLNAATVTGGATELSILPAALVPIAQNVQSGTSYHLFAGGNSTTAATPGTYTLAPRIGPAPTNASPLIGAVSSAFTPLASMTVAPFNIDGEIVIRGSGTSNTCAAAFAWSQTSVASAAAPGPSSVSSAGNLGGISASFDSTGTTCAFWLGVTHATSTTNTWIPQLVIWASWN
jgi:hypothetical protein